VDVNVHPTKHEIRFVDQRRVHNSVRDHVAQALAESERRLWQVPEVKPSAKGSDIAAEAIPPYRISSKAPPREKSGTDEPLVYQAGTVSGPTAPARGNAVYTPAAEPRTKGSENAGSSFPRESGAQQNLWQEDGFADLAVIGQFHGTYIICQGPRGLIFIDQHAAHERIVYEQFKARAGRIESQRLLVPETVEVGFAEAHILEKLIEHFSEWGLELEPFGGNTFVVKSVPTLLNDRNVTQMIIELAERAADIGLETGLEKVLDQCRMVMACHHSVRANQRLTDEQIGHMLTQLDQCDDPSHCPHGRPTWIQWTVKDLEKAFKRISS
jgi:DNA mismatch repair protein MutL